MLGLFAPSGLPPWRRARRSGTARLLVHWILPSSRGRPQQWRLVGGISFRWRFCVCGETHRPRSVGRRPRHSLPNAFKRAGRRHLLPAADKRRPPGAMCSDGEMIARMIVDAVLDRRPRLLRTANAEQTKLCEVPEHRSPPFRGSRPVSVGKRPPKCGRLPSRSRCCRVRLPCLATPCAGLSSGHWRQSWYCPCCLLLEVHRCS